MNYTIQVIDKTKLLYLKLILYVYSNEDIYICLYSIQLGIIDILHKFTNYFIKV